MAIVTRRYLYQGPPIDEIRNQTDPSLTLATAALKLAFDATFDNAVADVAAVDAAMAPSGLVPDPTADTSFPPTFPGGGSSNALFYRPGSALPGPIVFGSWADLMTTLTSLRASANNNGSYIIAIDDSIVSPAPIPVGAYDMTDVTLAGQADKLTSVSIPEGVVFTRLRHVTDNLQVTFTGATPPVSDFSAAPFESFTVERGSAIICAGTGPFLRNSATFVVVALLDSGKIAFGATQVVDVATSVPGTGVMVVGFPGANLESNTLSGITGSAVQLSWESSSSLLSEDQPTFTGAGGVLSLKNDTFSRRFPTPIITTNQGIGPTEVARVDTSGGPVSITLPPAFNSRGLETIVKDVGGNASVNIITVVPSGADTIDGAVSATISVDRGSLRLVSDGVSDWMIV